MPRKSFLFRVHALQARSPPRKLVYKSTLLWSVLEICNCYTQRLQWAWGGIQILCPHHRVEVWQGKVDMIREVARSLQYKSIPNLDKWGRGSKNLKRIADVIYGCTTGYWTFSVWWVVGIGAFVYRGNLAHLWWSTSKLVSEAHRHTLHIREGSAATLCKTKSKGPRGDGVMKQHRKSIWMRPFSLVLQRRLWASMLSNEQKNLIFASRQPLRSDLTSDLKYDV